MAHDPKGAVGSPPLSKAGAARHGLRRRGPAAAGPGARVLDVACGPGRVAAAAAARGAVATGVDLAPGMVALARSLHPGVAFREAEVESLPFGDGSFDALVCSFGIGHFPRPEAAVAECSRVVAPGGTLAFAW